MCVCCSYTFECADCSLVDQHRRGAAAGARHGERRVVAQLVADGPGQGADPDHRALARLALDGVDVGSFAPADLAAPAGP